jgi:hypothetical protein
LILSERYKSIRRERRNENVRTKRLQEKFFVLDRTFDDVTART